MLIFGVGPQTASSWYEFGMRSVEQVKQEKELYKRGDERVNIGKKECLIFLKIIMFSVFFIFRIFRKY